MRLKDLSVLLGRSPLAFSLFRSNSNLASTSSAGFINGKLPASANPSKLDLDNYVSAFLNADPLYKTCTPIAFNFHKEAIIGLMQDVAPEFMDQAPSAAFKVYKLGQEQHHSLDVQRNVLKIMLRCKYVSAQDAYSDFETAHSRSSGVLSQLGLAPASVTPTYMMRR